MNRYIVEGIGIGVFKIHPPLSGDVVIVGPKPQQKRHKWKVLARWDPEGSMIVPWGRVRLTRHGQKLAKRLVKQIELRCSPFHNH